MFPIFCLVDQRKASQHYRREGGKDPSDRLLEDSPDKRRDHRNRTTEGEADGVIPQSCLLDSPWLESRDKMVRLRVVMGLRGTHFTSISTRYAASETTAHGISEITLPASPFQRCTVQVAANAQATNPVAPATAPKALRLAGAVPLNRIVTMSEAKRTEGAAAKSPANLFG